MILETARLLLRPIIFTDVDAVFAYSSQQNVGPNAGWKPHASKEETLDIMKNIFVGQEHIFGLVWQANNQLFGSIGLIEDPKRSNNKAMMLGYAMSQQYWGQGIMTEAVKRVLRYGFESLNLDLISAYCYPHNIGSAKVLQKCGFEYEGRLRLCETLYDGKVYDNDCYALMHDDWQKNKPEA